MTNTIADKYTSQRSGRIEPMSALPPESEPLARARAWNLQRGLRLYVYLPIGLAVLAALLGAAALSYAAFANMINHALLADTLLILVLATAMVIAFFQLLLIMALVFALSSASAGVTSFFRNSQRISSNANRTAHHYADTTESQFERIHRLARAPTRALRSLRQQLRRLH